MSLVIFQLFKWKSANKLFLKGGLIENVIILYIVCIKENTMYETKYYLVFHTPISVIHFSQKVKQRNHFPCWLHFDFETVWNVIPFFWCLKTNSKYIMVLRYCFILKSSAETNTINQYSNIRECYSIRIRIFVDVIDSVLSIYDSLYY